MTIRSAICRVLTTLAATVAMPALSIAQSAPDVLPPREIINIVRAAGLQPVSRPAFRGATYVLRGVDESDELVRVIVDSRSGRVLSVRPLIALGQVDTRHKFIFGLRGSFLGVVIDHCASLGSLPHAAGGTAGVEISKVHAKGAAIEESIRISIV